MENIAVINSNKKDDLIIFTILVPFMLIACKDIVVSTLSLANIFAFELQIILNYLLVFIFFVICLYKISFRVSHSGLSIVFLSFLFFLISWFFHMDLFKYRVIYNALLSFIVTNIPYLLLIPLIRNTKKILGIFYSYSYIIAAFTLIVFILVFFFRLDTVAEYSMSYGKNSMLPCMFLFSKYFSEKKNIDLAFAIIIFGCIFLLGSRFPILCISLFVFFKIFEMFGSKKNRNILFVVFLILFLIFTFQNFENILKMIDSQMYKFGISSRTFTLLMRDSIMRDSGRSYIHEAVLNETVKSPILGHGAFGGHYILKTTSPHHLLIDIWANFGFIFGTLLLVYIIFLTIKNYINYRNTAYSELLMIFSCTVWPILNISGDFWSEKNLWMIISLFLLTKSYKHAFTNKDKKEAML